MNEQRSPMLSLRADLIQQRIQMGDRFVWILKDPLSRAFFYFSDREYSILKLVDGRRRISEIISTCRQRLAPDYIAAESVIRFLADAKQNGLMTSSAATGMGERTASDRSAQPSRWKNVLAIRFPGINPDWMLDFVTPGMRSFFSPVTMLAAVTLALIALATVIVNFDDFARHVGAAATRSSSSWLITVVVVVSLTKIIHELAHALACKAHGAECREIGVMLLVGIPCLFCDVSDAWMLKKRLGRIFVSAAGMLAELLIASVATFLWLFSNDGFVRDVCVTTMIVCSISTVLFNGNPLLRYDGYFILSDLLAIPNLASEASSLIRRTLRHWFWGMSRGVGQAAQTEKPRTKLLVTYGVLSGIYRTFVLAMICLLIYKLASGWGLAFIGVALAGLVLVPAIWRPIAAVIRRPSALEARSISPSRRPLLISLSVCVLALAALLVPLPRSIIAPAAIETSGAVDVFLETRGQLVSAVAGDGEVDEGDEIARFRSFETELELLALDARQKTLRAELDSLQSRRSFDRKAAGRIEPVSEALRAAENDYRQQSAEADCLVIHAPRSGAIFQPRNRYRQSSDDNAIETWSQTPLEKANFGSVFDEGTLLCSVGDQKDREAIVLVRQQDVSLVRPGQEVHILAATHDQEEFAGPVIEVARSPIQEVPREFFAAGMVDPSPESELRGATRETYYQVRVRLDDHASPMTIRSVARAKIRIEPASLASRLIRFVSDAFRFQL